MADDTTGRAFAAATSVVRTGEASFAATLDESFTVVGKPNGGYLLAVVARAATAHLQEQGSNHVHCLAATASYIRAASCAEVVVDVVVRRAGTRVTHVGAQLRQDDKVVVDALLSCGHLAEGAEVRHAASDAPALPDPDRCGRVPSGGPPGEGISIMDRVELRLDPATTGFWRGELAPDAEVRGWLRLADGEAFDPISLLFASDALPPATLPIGSTGWVPTIQLSAYVRAVPQPGWLVARQRARTVAGGLVDEVCELWDKDGNAVVQATQLAMVRF
jgi:hypothetical protein